ncbi:nicotinamide riboside transporter PnuC [Deinococcus sp. HSC-46F16]|nr:nicotinamide riboside transporter PnuC [Deinococcus sp. HSC-46F16]
MLTLTLAACGAGFAAASLLHTRGRSRFWWALLVVNVVMVGAAWHHLSPLLKTLDELLRLVP